MLRLPTCFGLTPDKEIVPVAGIGEEGYGENVEYAMTFVMTIREFEKQIQAAGLYP